MAAVRLFIPFVFRRLSSLIFSTTISASDWLAEAASLHNSDILHCAFGLAVPLQDENACFLAATSVVLSVVRDCALDV